MQYFILKYLLIICVIAATTDANMITSWNESNLPTPLAESISGYNKHKNNTIWLLGGWNGTAKTDSLFEFNAKTNSFIAQDYAGDKISISASSYTWIGDYMFFTNDFMLYQLTMNYDTKYHPVLIEKDNLPPTHYADTPSITTDPTQQKYLFVTGGVVNKSVVNTFSIYDIEKNNWISIPTPRMKYPRVGHNCIARHNYLYVFGGYINQTHTINKVEKLHIEDIDNINTTLWIELDSTLNNDIAYMRIAEFHGLIYIIGGYSETLNTSLNTVNILDPSTDEIRDGVNLTHDTNRGAVTENINGIVYLFGGYSNSSTLSIWQWSISDNKDSVKNLLWLYLVIAAVIMIIIAATCFLAYYKRWDNICEICERKVAAINRKISMISYGGAGEEGQSIDIRNLIGKDGSVSRFVMDTSYESN